MIVSTDEIVYYDNEFACIFGQKSDIIVRYFIFSRIHTIDMSLQLWDILKRHTYLAQYNI